MAQITVDTGLNTKPVMQGISQMNGAIRSMKTTIGKLGKSLDASTVGYAKAMNNTISASKKLDDALRIIGATLASLKGKMLELAETKVETNEYKGLKKELENAEKSYNKVIEAQKKLRDLGKDTTINKEYAATIKKLDTIDQKLKRLNDQRQLAESAYRQARVDVKQAQTVVDASEKKIEGLKRKRTVTASKAEVQQYTDQIKQEQKILDEEKKKLQYAKDEARANDKQLDGLAQKIGLAEEEYDRLDKKKQAFETSGNTQQISESMRRYQYEAQNAAKAVSDLQEKLKKLEAEGKATVDGRTTDEYKKVEHEYLKAQKEYVQVERATFEAYTPVHLKEWETMSTLTGQISEKVAKFSIAIQTAFYGIHHPLQAVNRILPGLLSALGSLAQKAFNVAMSFGKMAIRTVVTTVKRLASAAWEAATGLARMAGSAVVSFLRRLANGAKNAALWLARVAATPIKAGLKKVGSLAASAGKAILGIGKSARRSNNGLGQAVKMLVRYGFGVSVSKHGKGCARSQRGYLQDGCVFGNA